LWWRVTAPDRGGHATWGTPPVAWFRTQSGDPSAVVEGPPPGATLRLWPNPAPERVWMRVKLTPGEDPPRIEVVDASGRCVARSSGGDVRGPDRGLFCWSLRDASGRTVPSGLYWVRVLRGEARAAAAPVMVVR